MAATEEAPEFAYAWNVRGNTLRYLERWLEAGDSFGRAIQLSESPSNTRDCLKLAQQRLDRQKPKAVVQHILDQARSVRTPAPPYRDTWAH